MLKRHSFSWQRSNCLLYTMSALHYVCFTLCLLYSEVNSCYTCGNFSSLRNFPPSGKRPLTTSFFLPSKVFGIIIHRLIEIQNISLLDNLLKEYGCLFKFHGNFMQYNFIPKCLQICLRSVLR